MLLLQSVAIYSWFFYIFVVLIVLKFVCQLIAVLFTAWSCRNLSFKFFKVIHKWCFFKAHNELFFVCIFDQNIVYYLGFYTDLIVFVIFGWKNGTARSCLTLICVVHWQLKLLSRLSQSNTSRYMLNFFNLIFVCLLN